MSAQCLVFLSFFLYALNLCFSPRILFAFLVAPLKHRTADSAMAPTRVPACQWCDVPAQPAKHKQDLQQSQLSGFEQKRTRPVHSTITIACVAPPCMRSCTAAGEMMSEVLAPVCFCFHSFSRIKTSYLEKAEESTCISFLGAEVSSVGSTSWRLMMNIRYITGSTNSLVLSTMRRIYHSTLKPLVLH